MANDWPLAQLAQLVEPRFGCTKIVPKKPNLIVIHKTKLNPLKPHETSWDRQKNKEKSGQYNGKPANLALN